MSHLSRVTRLTLALLTLGATAAVADEAVEAKPAPAPARAPGAALLSGAQVFQRFLEASGGVAAFQAPKNIVTAGKFSMPAQGMSGTINSWQSGEKVLARVEMTGLGVMEQGYDGKIGWSKDPMQGPRVLSATEIAQMKLSDIQRMKDPTAFFKTMELLGVADFEGKKAHEVRVVSAEGGFEAKAYFDVRSNLMLGMKLEQESPMGKVPMTMVMSDYKDFSGMKIPTRMVNRIAAMGQTMEQVITVESVQINVADFPAIEAPADVKALAARPAAKPAG